MILPGLTCICMGAVLTWIGWSHWRHRDSDEHVALIEAAILRGEEPLPRTRLDRVLDRIQAVAGLTLGALFILVGIAVVLP